MTRKKLPDPPSDRPSRRHDAAERPSAREPQDRSAIEVFDDEGAGIAAKE